MTPSPTSSIIKVARLDESNGAGNKDVVELEKVEARSLLHHSLREDEQEKEQLLPEVGIMVDQIHSIERRETGCSRADLRPRTLLTSQGRNLNN